MGFHRDVHRLRRAFRWGRVRADGRGWNVPKVEFPWNQPVEVALQYTTGMPARSAFGPQQTMFTLTDGRKMYLDAQAAQAVNDLRFEPGEYFTITRRAENGNRASWSVQRIAPAPSHRPTPPQTSLAPPSGQKRASYAAVSTVSAEPAQKVPFDQAFGEIVAFVSRELAARGEQWSDQARQAAVCTLVIQAGREGWLAPWERPR
jgi:hypothetical protein